MGIFLCTSILMSCTEEPKNDDLFKTPIPSISITETPDTLSCEADTVYIAYEAKNGTPNVFCSDTWISTELQADDNKIEVRSAANPTSRNRTANIRIVNGTAKEIVSIVQKGNTNIDPDALSLGDPGVTFDKTMFDPNYPQMERWSKAGVTGGIPFVDEMLIVTELTACKSAEINAAINAATAKMNAQGAKRCAILLKNGTYDINAQVNMVKNVSLIGESRHGVQCIINASVRSGAGFNFDGNDSYCGIYRLTIKGGWLNKNGENKPFYDWNIGEDANHELNGNTNISIFMRDAKNCWVDGVDIINSADFPLRFNAEHITLRDLHVDGCFNKAGGCQGYFYFIGSDNLLVDSYITHIRHISIQGEGAEYNVLYNNDLEQEISFHSGDKGNNLIEFNRITLPADMPPGGQYGGPGYYAIMGPWSNQHHNSLNPNFVYRNKCQHLNHKTNYTPWSDDNKIYMGPKEKKPANPLTNFPERPSSFVPKGGTLYPVIL